MNWVLYPACAAVTFLALLYRLPALIRRPEPALVALCCYFAILTIAFTLSTPPVFVGVSKFFGVPNIAGMLTQCGALLAAVMQQVVVLAWAYPWAQAKLRIRWLFVLTVSALTCMAVLFGIAVQDMTVNPHNFAVDSAAISSYQLYLAVYLSCYVLGLVESVRLCWRYSSEVGPGWLRSGLRTAAAGSSLGLVYAAARGADIFAAHIGLDGRQWESVARLGAAGATLLMVVGWTMPTWGPLLSRTWAQFGRYRTYYRLWPLWQALYNVVPDIALALPKQRGISRLPLSHLDLHLYRRIVEIRDARMALLPFFDIEFCDAVRTRAEQQGLRSRRLDAVVEAANLAAAIEAKKRWDAGSSTMPRTVAGDFDPPDETGGSLHDELDWLVLVAVAFARSPVVADAISALPDHKHLTNPE